MRTTIVHLATSADAFIARPDGDLDWLTNRPAPKGFYGLPNSCARSTPRSLGRKTFDVSVEMGAPFSAGDTHCVFSRRPAPRSAPAGDHVVTQPIRVFAKQMRAEAGKNLWVMGGAEIIGSFLDEGAIDEFVITIVPMFIGEGIPLLSPRHRQVPLRPLSAELFPDAWSRCTIRSCRAGSRRRPGSGCRRHRRP